MSAREPADAEEVRRAARMVRAARAGAVAIALLGLAVLAGWAFDVRALRQVADAWVPMKANTACAFVLAGAALLGLTRTGRPPAATLASVGLAAAAAVLGALNLVEDLAGADFGIDQFLVADPTRGPGTSAPGRMAPATALGFVLLGTAVAGVAAPRRDVVRAASVAAVVAHVVASVALLGYVFGVDGLYAVLPFNTIAVHTAAGLWIGTASTLLARPDAGIGRLLACSTAAGDVARRLLPAIPFALVAVGGAVLAGARRGLYDVQFAVALVTVLGMVVTSALVVRQSATLRQVDRRRRTAEDDLVALNASLERRVVERTQELRDALDRVRTLEGMIPMCAWCRRIAGDAGTWVAVEDYISQRTPARVSHGMCPDCVAREERNAAPSRRA